MFNHTIISLPSYQASDSTMNIITLAMSLMWGSAELLISMGSVTAFSFIICYTFGAVMETKDMRFEDPEAPSKENTASMFMSAMLNGFHMTFVFFGLPLLGHAADPFALRLLYSFAIIAALTTGVALGTITICLAIPVVRSVIGIFRRKTPIDDVEAQVERQPFIFPAEKEPLPEKE